MSDTDRAWLASLNAGDAVAVAPGYRSRFADRPWLARVERTTRTQIIVGGARYSRATGVEIGTGQGWAGTLVVPSIEISAAVRRARLVAWLKTPRAYVGATDEEIERLHEIVSAIDARNREGAKP